MKPWDIQYFQVILRRAMEFHILSVERDKLLKEKLSVFQKMVICDKIRSLAIFSSGLVHRYRNSMTALKAFLDMIPDNVIKEVVQSQSNKNPDYMENLWEIAEQELQRIVNMSKYLMSIYSNAPSTFKDKLKVNRLLEPVVSELKDKADNYYINLNVNLENDYPDMLIEKSMILKMLTIVFDLVIKFSPKNSNVSVTAEETNIDGNPAIKIMIRNSSGQWSDEQIASIFQLDISKEIELNLLAAIFITYHHGGEFQIHPRCNRSCRCCRCDRSRRPLN